jgi:hypothetical protein
MCSHCLFPACWQVVNGSLTTCYTVVELIRLVTGCSNNLLSSCDSTICQQVVSDKLDKITLYNLLTSLPPVCCEHILLTSCKIFMCVFWRVAWGCWFQKSRYMSWMVAGPGKWGRGCLRDSFKWGGKTGGPGEKHLKHSKSLPRLVV